MQIGKIDKFELPIYWDNERSQYRCRFLLNGKRIDLGRSPDRLNLARRYISFQQAHWRKADKELSVVEKAAHQRRMRKYVEDYKRWCEEQ